jgi:hypothetical protein
VEKTRTTTFVLNWKEIIPLCFLITIVGTGCLTGSHPKSNEPSYQGKSLSQWLADFNNPSPKCQALAADAIRHIGSQAVPFLVDRLSEAKLKESKLKNKKWQEKQKNAVYSVPPPPSPWLEAMAGLDALGPEAADALPTLQKLLQKDPPDLQALYVAARIGSAGMLLLTESLTNEVKAVRISSQVCLDMMRSHSEVLYPKIPFGPDTPSFALRNCEFNSLVLKAAVQVYIKEHPEFNSRTNFVTPPPTSQPIPVPVQ